ncbi:ExeA family protein [Marinobacter sp. SS21]|uniref:ExeA family protein n=1 Tax=Marinobacter sp. SS21 TaxID=2979460 RepID=UPI00232A912E|nr:AAA family ATPase [Marinobacter sp. SS21]MDC0661901.1 AAA family ATPase [Marinobacter sp. SS21]
MYYEFFGFREPPFSIAPDPRYLYLSDRHKEALAHLMYGVGGQGGFIVITGEVGTGKTTVSRCFIDNAPDNVDMAIVLNPRLSARELLSSICDELGIAHPAGSSIKRLVDLINQDLLEAYAAGRHKVLLIDEAQNLSAEVLEQLRLLTNLETAEKKLLQIVLIGQPELNDILAQPELRQLNQRVTARYHLDSLGRNDLPSYLRFRLSVAGVRGELFSPGAIKSLYKLSAGIPRLINLICDRALLGAYAEGEHRVGAETIKVAAKEVIGKQPGAGRRHTAHRSTRRYGAPVLVTCMVVAVALTMVAMEFFRAGLGPGLAGIEQAVANGIEDHTDLSAAGTVERPAPATSGSAPDDSASPPASPVESRPEFQFESGGLSQRQAFEALFQLWGEQYVPSEYPVACEFAKSRSLDCLYREGTRRSLEQLNRPAILRLVDEQGATRFVALASLDSDHARLQLPNGEQQTVRFGELERYWFGDFIILWRLPPYLSENRNSQLASSKELWLSAQLMQLAELYGNDVDERTRVKAMDYPSQVRWYQGKKGLKVDGIAGAMTLIQVNNDLNPGVPRLLRSGDFN